MFLRHGSLLWFIQKLRHENKHKKRYTNEAMVQRVVIPEPETWLYSL